MVQGQVQAFELDGNKSENGELVPVSVAALKAGGYITQEKCPSGKAITIEDGKVTAPLKGVNLIGNGPETLRDVTMLGNDVTLSDGIWTCGKDGQSVPVGVGCPTVKIARITVGGTEIG